MNVTPYPDINQVLDELLSGIQQVLGDKLIGLYLYGSLVWGDFDYGTSDIDLLAATAFDVDEQGLAALRQMHAALAARHPRWDNKIEVQYFSLEGLKTFKSRASSMVNISPGEPIHIIQAGKEWLLNWYFVQDYGITLYGPPPQTFIDPISKDEFVEAVRQHAQDWRVYIKRMRDSKGQSYAILTLCRALYTTRNKEQVSKQKAALWAEQQLPEWSALIQNALVWRKAPKTNQASFAETEKFVYLVIDQIVGEV